MVVMLGAFFAAQEARAKVLAGSGAEDTLVCTKTNPLEECPRMYGYMPLRGSAKEK